MGFSIRKERGKVSQGSKSLKKLVRQLRKLWPWGKEIEISRKKILGLILYGRGLMVFLSQEEKELWVEDLLLRASIQGGVHQARGEIDVEIGKRNHEVEEEEGRIPSCGINRSSQKGSLCLQVGGTPDQYRVGINCKICR
jgi:hypothetical protein